MINGAKKVAILAADGFEQSELLKPLEALKKAGMNVDVISIHEDEIKAWNKDDWGTSVDVDFTVEEADPAEYDALVLPGGQMNPDNLRMVNKAIEFIRHFTDARKPVAAICHGPWTLIDAEAVSGRRMTSYPSIRRDLENAGADWVDEEVVVDGNLITSRKPEDLPAFCEALINMLNTGTASLSGKRSSHTKAA